MKDRDHMIAYGFIRNGITPEMRAEALKRVKEQDAKEKDKKEKEQPKMF